jgi:hypothetical protein
VAADAALSCAARRLLEALRYSSISWVLASSVLSVCASASAIFDSSVEEVTNHAGKGLSAS